MTTVAAAKLQTGIRDILDLVIHHGERVAVERNGEPVAALVSTDDLKLLQAIEDRIDIEAAHRAMSEPGLHRWEDVKAELGLLDLDDPPD